MAILSTYLRDGGYQVDEADNGLKAWEILQKNKNYDVIITDRRMPEMDGLELSKLIKAAPDLQRIPILMQTSADTTGEISEGIQSGVYYYLTKPYEEETLLTITRAAIRDREQNNIFADRLSHQPDALQGISQGEFTFQTPDEAENIALLVGRIFPSPELAVPGLYELLINAVEHGNLEIGYEEKGRLLASGTLEDEIQRRLNLPEYKNRKAIIQYSNNGNEIRVRITDEGKGFDWQPFIKIETSRATSSNGRGIVKAKFLNFEKMDYYGTGNQVRISNKLIKQ